MYLKAHVILGTAVTFPSDLHKKIKANQAFHYTFLGNETQAINKFVIARSKNQWRFSIAKGLPFECAKNKDIHTNTRLGQTTRLLALAIFKRLTSAMQR